jgi:transcriptional regulator with XRE-family HTH domain
MPNTKPLSQLAAPISADPQRRARVDQLKRAMLDAVALAELRATRQVTQKQMADRLSISQPNISRLEHGTDLYLSTLVDYIEALGGNLELTAVFPEGRVSLLLPGPQQEAAEKEAKAEQPMGAAPGQA